MNRRNAFTLLELCIVLLIIGIMAALLFPVCSCGDGSRAKARRIMCLSNTKQQGLALMMYAQDYDEQFPANPSRWMDISQPYVKNWDVYQCPLLTANEYGYAFDTRMAGKNQKTLASPDHVTLILESTNKQKNAYTKGEGVSSRHDGWGNKVFADGHAKAIRNKKQAESMLKL